MMGVGNLLDEEKSVTGAFNLPYPPSYSVAEDILVQNRVAGGGVSDLERYAEPLVIITNGKLDLGVWLGVLEGVIKQIA